VFFSGAKTPRAESEETFGLLARIVGLVLEGCALHAVEFDAEAHSAFRSALRSIARRFERGAGTEDFLLLAGETNHTLQLYGKSVEKHLGLITAEKHRAIGLLTESLLRVCHGSQESAQAVRAIELDLRKASQLEDMRLLRAKLAEAIETLCEEGNKQADRVKDLMERLSGSSAALGSRDTVTGLPTLQHAEARIQEVASSGQQGFVLAFFLKNVEVVNKRFGFAAGDAVLKRFTEYLGKNYVGLDQLFRWRGPCFLVVSQRAGTLETFKAEADRMASRGPGEEVEGNGKSMLFRLTAATAIFPITKEQNNSDFAGKIDRFAAEQFNGFRTGGS
jgi:GGDEF domain-containing protein